MPLHTPKVHFNPNMQIITTPNKNIQSYFMRSENSHFVKDSEKFLSYKKDDDNILTVIILTTDLIFCSSFEDCVILTNDISKYENVIIEPVDPNLDNNEECQKQADTKLVYNDFKTNILSVPKIMQDIDFFNELFYMSNFNALKFENINHAIVYFYKKIQNIYPHNYRKTFINLVFQDLFNRTEIMSITDMFLKWFGCKGIMLTPYSLACCFGSNVPSATIIHFQNQHSQAAFVDDFCYIYGHKISRECEEIPLFKTLDADDFAEEFNKQRFRIGKRIFTCKLCSMDFEQHCDIIFHLKTNHTNIVSDENDDHFDDYFTEKGEDILFKGTDEEENLNLLFQNLGTEKEKKVSVVRIIVGNKDKSKLYECDENVSLIKDLAGMCALRGALAFINLDCSKEMWMTDVEWYNGGLRILKEKLLFYI